MIHPKIYNKIVNTPAHKAAQKVHSMLFPFPANWKNAKGAAANNLIKEALLSEKPCLIARLGKTETEAVMAIKHQDTSMPIWSRLYRFLSWDVPYKGWQKIAPKLRSLSGVFPAQEDTLHRFAQTYLDSMPQIDVIGSWLHAETLLQDNMPEVQRIPLQNLEPYFFENPWSEALKGKRVLVIHPFIQSIQMQYEKHALLFKNPNTLPEFELIPLQAVQSLGGKGSLPFSSWFEALESMKTAINEKEFDIAIIGAGAYGLPLAAHIKTLGKKAVHLGGATQMLFGIYGQRWIDDPARKPFINEHWIRPLDTDKIEAFQQIENGCYW